MAATVGVDAPPIALLVGLLMFLAGLSLGTSMRYLRPRAPLSRRWVQPRSDVDRSRQ